MSNNEYKRTLIHDALNKLQIEHLSLGVFEPSLPSTASEETGRGSLYSRGAELFFKFIADLGFTTIQLGPLGKTSFTDPSPYNSTVFSKNPLSLSLYKLQEQFPELLQQKKLPHPFMQTPDSVSNVDYLNAWNLIRNYETSLYHSFKESMNPSLNRTFSLYLAERFNDSINWLERDAIYSTLNNIHKTEDWQYWPKIDKYLYGDITENINSSRIDNIKKQYKSSVEQYSFTQFLLDYQHSEFKKTIHNYGLKIYGDLQIGYSHQDIWAYKNLFLPTYLMGAPPSRSNPEGQPWGYPVLNPNLFFRENGLGPALQLMQARIDKMFREFDGVRIDHPHGLVCPWVYNSNDPDPLHAVQNGARLYSSPSIAEHKELSKFSIVSESQLNKSPDCQRYSDDWVTDLTTEQINTYAIIIDLILNRAAHYGAGKSDIICEVLSTWPLPLKKVMQTRELGRFCITQKADPFNPADIYRRENTRAQDWIMPGNHDTKPVWLLVPERARSQWYNARANILAQQFSFSEDEKNHLLKKLIADPNIFCTYLFAELFLGPARHVYLFISDLFGINKTFNRPGLIHPDNWSMRIPPDFINFYRKKTTANQCFNLPLVLSIALKTRFPNQETVLNLAQRLSEVSQEF